MARANGARSQMALAFETTYGVPPESGYSRMPFASATLGAAQPLLNSELLGYGRDPLAPIKDAVTADGDVVIPIDARAFGIWLKATFGDPVTTAVAATGLIAFSVIPANGQTVTIGGVTWTFVTGTAGASEVEIEGTLIQTLDALVIALNGSANVEIAKATYSRPTGTENLVVTFDTVGPTGNAFTLAASHAVPSGATLTGGGYSHEYRSGGWTLPSMAIEIGHPEIPAYFMYPGCVLDQLNFSMQRAGLLTATARLVVQGEEEPTAASEAGSLEDIELQRFGHFNGSIRRNGTALGNVVTTELTYQNNLDRIETIRADGKIDGADPSLAGLMGRIDVRFADLVLLDQAIAGEACEIAMGWALPAGASLTFVAHAVYLPRPRREVTGPQGIQASFEWQAAQTPEGSRMCTVTLINDVVEY